MLDVDVVICDDDEDEEVVVVVDEGFDVTTKYAATPAMTRIMTTIATVAVELIALRCVIFILERLDSTYSL